MTNLRAAKPGAHPAAREKRGRYPGSRPKGELQKGLKERYGHERATGSEEPTSDARVHGASNVGEDTSSGSETVATDPTRFPEENETEEATPARRT